MACLHERRHHDEPTGLAEREVDERDARGPVGAAVHQAKTFGLQTDATCGGHGVQQSVGGVDETRAAAFTEGIGRRAHERCELAVPSASSRLDAGASCRAPIALEGDVGWVGDDERRRVKQGRSDAGERAFEITAPDGAAILESVGLDVAAAERCERRLALDEVDAVRHPQMKKREPHRADPRPEIDGAPDTTTFFTGKGGEQDRVHVGAVAVPRCRLKELETAAEKGIFGDLGLRRGAQAHLSSRGTLPRRPHERTSSAADGRFPMKNGPGGLSRATRPADFRAPYLEGLTAPIASRWVQDSLLLLSCLQVRATGTLHGDYPSSGMAGTRVRPTGVGRVDRRVFN